MSIPPVSNPVADVLSRFPAPLRDRFYRIREAIFTVAAETAGVGALTETLKWGEPAYLTEATGSGTTIRLGTAKSAPQDCAILLNCKTTLIETFRMQFADDFEFEGTRALIMPLARPLPHIPLALCIGAALTYHRRKRTSA